MLIRTKYNTGDRVYYDEDKLGEIIGYEIYSNKGIFYILKSEDISNQVDLINNGNLRNENELKQT
jgi:hypothetical protein